MRDPGHEVAEAHERYVACVAGSIASMQNNVLTAEPLKVSGEATRKVGRRTLKYHLYENHTFLNSPHTSVQEKWTVCGKNGLVERSTHVNQMLNDPSYISQGTLALLMTNYS